MSIFPQHPHVLSLSLTDTLAYEGKVVNILDQVLYFCWLYLSHDWSVLFDHLGSPISGADTCWAMGSFQLFPSSHISRYPTCKDLKAENCVLWGSGQSFYRESGGCAGHLVKGHKQGNEGGSGEGSWRGRRTGLCSPRVIRMREGPGRSRKWGGSSDPLVPGPGTAVPETSNSRIFSLTTTAEKSLLGSSTGLCTWG